MVNRYKEIEENQRNALSRMRNIATGLLLLMTILFIVVLILERYFPLIQVYLEFIRSFAEAAMVGAIADWFAVTALFRHPLGLPIPHTAIIPTKKDSIGQGLANFIEKNFLTAEALQAKLESFELSRKLGEWLAVPENSELIADNISIIIPSILNTLKDDDVRKFIENNIAMNIRGEDLSVVAGDILTILTANNKHNDFFNEALKLAEKLLDENKLIIKQQIREESPWLVRAFVANRVYEKIIAKAESTFLEVANNKNHALRKNFNKAIEDFIENLKTSPEFHQKVELMKEEFFQNPTVHRYLDQVWIDLKLYLIENFSNPDSTIRRQLQDNIYTFCNNLIKDEMMRNKLTAWIYEGIINLVSKYRQEISSMITETIKKWDEKTMSNKLELQVGKDLQYIRISGTLVGGCVGFLIHTIGFILHKLF